MKIFNEFDDKFWKNEKKISVALLKYFVPILFVNSLILFMVFKDTIEDIKLLKVSFVFSMAIYSVIATVKNLPYYAKREEYSEGFNKLVGHSISIVVIFVFYITTIITFGPSYPSLKKFICCDKVNSWYMKTNKKEGPVATLKLTK